MIDRVAAITGVATANAPFSNGIDSTYFAAREDMRVTSAPRKNKKVHANP